MTTTNKKNTATGMSLESTEEARPFIDNPYNARDDEDATNMLPARHPYNLVKRGLLMSGSLWGLDKFHLYQNVISNTSRVRHDWLKMGVATTLCILIIKTYMEVWVAKFKKKSVTYDTFPQTTHAIMGLFVFATVSFNLALWPHYGGMETALILTMMGFGLLLQFALLFPTYIQNPLGFVLMAFFLIEYR